MWSETRSIFTHKDKVLLFPPSLLSCMGRRKIQREAQYDGFTLRRGRAESLLRPQESLEVLEVHEIALRMLVDGGMNLIWIV